MSVPQTITGRRLSRRAARGVRDRFRVAAGGLGEQVVELRRGAIQAPGVGAGLDEA